MGNLSPNFHHLIALENKPILYGFQVYNVLRACIGVLCEELWLFFFFFVYVCVFYK
jgi:hypothetical protein